MTNQKNPTEKELKLVSQFNNQLKYNDIRSQEEVVKKIKASLDILDISYTKTKIITQSDKYYDTEDNYLIKNEISLRFREVEKKNEKQCYITLKTKAKKEVGNVLSRYEKEEKLNDISNWKDKIRKCIEEVVDTNNFEMKDAVQIINNRILIPINTGKNAYNLCFDKYFFCVKGRRSDDLYEIEIESESENNTNTRDKKIDKLCDLFTQVFGYKTTKKSKYEQGMQWKSSEIDVKNKNFVLIDIVDYSKKIPELQKDIVIMLNKQIKKCLEDLDFFKKTIALPIGDGAILAFEENINIIRFIQTIVSALNIYNNSIPEKNKTIEVRFAIHNGPVFEFPDINGNTNYAGNGINIVSRIASKTKAKTIFVSEAFLNWCNNSAHIDTSIFSDKFEIEVKHGEKIIVREMQNYLK